ncbi:MAG TPA: alpha/beta hydrolase [Gammaproteobacteria bacterium]|nr:alpha/beta hydrolase [Gammaproteobacteria bacterium]
MVSQGFRTLSVDLPGRTRAVDPKTITLQASAKALCAFAATLEPPLAYVAHSQGGAVVNHALGVCPELAVDAIVYVAAVAPLDGEKPFARLNKADETHYFEAIAYEEASGWMHIKDPQALVQHFSHKPSPRVTQGLLRGAVDEPAVIGEGKVSLNTQRFADIRQYYVYTRFDKIVSLTSQRAIAKQLTLRDTAMLETGHVPMFSQPQALADVIATFLSASQ